MHLLLTVAAGLLQSAPAGFSLSLVRCACAQWSERPIAFLVKNGRIEIYNFYVCNCPYFLQNFHFLVLLKHTSKIPQFRHIFFVSTPTNRNFSISSNILHRLRERVSNCSQCFSMPPANHKECHHIVYRIHTRYGFPPLFANS